MTTRREFIGTLAGGLLATPLAAEAQQAAKVARIGWLAATNATTDPHLREASFQGLCDLGYIEGRNLVIEFRGANRQGSGPAQTGRSGGQSGRCPLAARCSR